MSDSETSTATLGKDKVKILVMNNPVAKRLFFSEKKWYTSMRSLEWLLGVALLAPPAYKMIDIDIMVFEESIEFYRNQGIDVTIDKIVRHELQHIAMARKHLNTVEPLISIAQEYGIIEDMKTPMCYHLVKPHWAAPNVPWQDFYSHAEPKDYEMKWYEISQDSVCISPRPSNQTQELPLRGMERTRVWVPSPMRMELAREN